MKKVFLFLTTLISLSALTIDGSAQIDRGELGSLTTVKDGLRSRRISSADKTGNNGDCVGQFKPGEKWSVEIPVQAGEKKFKYEQKVKLVNPKLYGRGYAIGDMGHTDYVLLADDIVAVEEK